MRSQLKTHFVWISFFLLSFGLFYFNYSPTYTPVGKILITYFPVNTAAVANGALLEQPIEKADDYPVSASITLDSSNSDAILWPGWEVVMLSSPEIHLDSLIQLNFTCKFANGETSPARFSSALSFTNQTAFKCIIPQNIRRRKPISRPIITSSPENITLSESGKLFTWNHIVFDSISTEHDVVVFAKGLNRHLTKNRRAEELNCVFGDGTETPSVRTTVTSSVQEVFRCSHPNITTNKPIKVTLEIITEPNKYLFPSAAYYIPKRTIAKPHNKSLICATTMVYNVAKFLREWVLYHSKIGVEKFILYDNESEDNLLSVIRDLNRDGYDVNHVNWIWPKTQEAGFSHAAINGNDSCTWMMYLDVDEYLFAPSWLSSSQAPHQMIPSLLPNAQNNSIGQVSFKSYEFGPSGQVVHPVRGVTQGYNYRRLTAQRHKSIVLLAAIKNSLYNAVHHFVLKEEYTWELPRTEIAVINHYKYQAWIEFKNKFRRRVSAYTIDWTKNTNMGSKDRTPGLGSEAVEPDGWTRKFCDVKDEGLKLLAGKWFGSQTPTGYRMAWQR